MKLKEKKSIESFKIADQLTNYIDLMQQDYENELEWLSEEDSEKRKITIGSLYALCIEYYLKSILLTNLEFQIPSENVDLQNFINQLTEEDELKIITSEISLNELKSMLNIYYNQNHITCNSSQLNQNAKLLTLNSFKEYSHDISKMLGIKNLNNTSITYLPEEIKKYILDQIYNHLMYDTKDVQDISIDFIVNPQEFIENIIKSPNVASAFPEGRYAIFNGKVPNLEILKTICDATESAALLYQKYTGKRLIEVTSINYEEQHTNRMLIFANDNSPIYLLTTDGTIKGIIDLETNKDVYNIDSSSYFHINEEKRYGTYDLDVFQIDMLSDGILYYQNDEDINLVVSNAKRLFESTNESKVQLYQTAITKTLNPKRIAINKINLSKKIVKDAISNFIMDERANKRKNIINSFEDDKLYNTKNYEYATITEFSDEVQLEFDKVEQYFKIKHEFYLDKIMTEIDYLSQKIENNEMKPEDVEIELHKIGIPTKLDFLAKQEQKILISKLHDLDRDFQNFCNVGERNEMIKTNRPSKTGLSPERIEEGISSIDSFDLECQINNSQIQK